MIVYRTKYDLSTHLDAVRSAGKIIGLVPTMGALHEGHISLVRKATADNDITVVSIFVNPAQFNDPTDLENYPRTLEKDLEILQEHDTDLVFVPSLEEIYPEKESSTFDLGGLDRVMEGLYRKGHFDGVALIVSKLFKTVIPHRAYFGQKDFQQLVIVRRLVKMMQMDVEIVSCPIVREIDGLAMSSRNMRLTRDEREIAPFIYITLQLARQKQGSLSPDLVKDWVKKQFENQPLMKMEYFEIVEDKGLESITEWDERVNQVGCIAVYLGEVRLIDNIFFD